MGFSRQEYWSGLPFPSPGDLPDPGIEPRSPALQADTLPSEPQGKPWKTVWRVLKMLGIKSPHDPAIPLLGIYPEEMKIERDTFIPLFIAALFTIARKWKQPRCPLTDELIKSYGTYTRWNITQP